jgi:hypothetical protein
MIYTFVIDCGTTLSELGKTFNKLLKGVIK